MKDQDSNHTRKVESRDELARLSQDYHRIEQAIEFIETRQEDQPGLAEVAESVHLSEFHFQKLFSRWVGISPKRFLQYLTKEHAKKLLENAGSILDVTYETGLSSPGRLHDLFIACEAVTPGEYKRRGEGLVIEFGFTPSPFGPCLIARTTQGICALKFVREQPEQNLADWLGQQWPRAVLRREDTLARALAHEIFASGLPETPAPLHLFVKGTNFQIKVWEALTRIPLGHTVTYQDIARHIGHPNAVRAVGTAIGRNPIPFLIPCHRVIRKSGIFGNYGEGPARKKAILGWESAITETEPVSPGQPAPA